MRQGIAVFVLSLLAATTAAAAGSVTGELMPVPSSVTWGQGGLAVDGRFSIGMAGPDDGRVGRALGRTAAWLAKEAKLPHAPKVSRGSGTLSVAWKAAGEPVQKLGEDESYRLAV